MQFSGQAGGERAQCQSPINSSQLSASQPRCLPIIIILEFSFESLFLYLILGFDFVEWSYSILDWQFWADINNRLIWLKVSTRIKSSWSQWDQVNFDVVGFYSNMFEFLYFSISKFEWISLKSACFYMSWQNRCLKQNLNYFTVSQVFELTGEERQKSQPEKILRIGIFSTLRSIS